MRAFLKLVTDGKRWSDLLNSSAYSVNKKVLINSTDVRTSNSAAMYLSLAKLDGKVAEFIEVVINNDAQSAAFQDKVMAIHKMGNQEIRASSSVSNRMLDRPVKVIKGGLFDEKSPISKSLIDLRNTIEDLDPAKQGVLLSPRKILGRIPFGDRLRTYFMKYQSSQSHINAIITSLYHGQDELRKDNADIEEEKRNIWKLMEQLQQYVYIGKQVDTLLEKRLAEIESVDPEKGRVVREEMPFNVRQKVQDLLTQLAVNIQGYLALDIIRTNNFELIKGVERATTTTVSALRTAVLVAQALANQKLVLNQITALNTATSNMIESTSQMLKQQSTQIHQQSTEATVNIEKLHAAFNNVMKRWICFRPTRSKH